MSQVGIEKIAFYTPQFVVDLTDIAARDGIDEQKFLTGIGQERFAMPPHDEDIVTMAANAAEAILEDADKTQINSVILATESGIDQSKSAAVYVHHLLELPHNCRAFEVKQACYSATAALKMACDEVALNPDKKVLVIASDIAHYALNTPAEATQGAAAVAMLVSATPTIASYQGKPGVYTSDVMDFWRPNQQSTPLVNGRLSTKIYLEACAAAWQDFAAQNAMAFADFDQFCYHLPFSKMANKAHQYLCRLNDVALDENKIHNAMIYNRIIGNCYTASLYLGLCSLLDFGADLDNQDVALMSYGSGCVGEFFHLRITEGYRAHLKTELHRALIANRKKLSLADYEAFWHRPDMTAASDFTNATQTQGHFRFAGVAAHQRMYARQ